MNHGGDVWRGDSPAEWLDFSANIRPGGPPEWVRRALLGAAENAAYYPQPGQERARGALGEFLGLDSALTLPTAGGIGAIALAARLRADRARVPAPAFGEYERLSAQNGLPVERVPLLGAGREILPLRESLGAGLRENTCVWLCNPSNPLGAAFPRGEVEGLLAAVEAKNGWLVVDEAFIDYCPEHSVRDLTAVSDRLLVVGSMTKILGVPGVRLGYLCAGRALRDLEAYQNPWELNCFAQGVLLALPENRGDIAREAERNRDRRQGFRAGLERLGAYVYPSEANFLLCDFGRDVAPLEEYLSGRKILTRGCRDFPGVDDGRHLRLAVKDRGDNEKFIRTMEEAIQCAENP